LLLFSGRLSLWNHYVFPVACVYTPLRNQDLYYSACTRSSLQKRQNRRTCVLYTRRSEVLTITRHSVFRRDSTKTFVDILLQKIIMKNYIKSPVSSGRYSVRRFSYDGDFYPLHYVTIRNNEKLNNIYLISIISARSYIIFSIHVLFKYTCHSGFN
jgi:hypothetical protein